MSNTIEVDNITKSYGGRKVLDRISFNVKKQSIHGFLGPNGAGKTTTMKIIANLLRPDEGEVRIDGKALNLADKSFHQKIGFLLEVPPLYGDLKVREYLKFIATLKRVSSDQLKSRIDYCVDVLDLAEVENRLIENLSRGFKQRVGIAQAIIHMPEIVLLDEPTIGLDPQTVVEIRNLILKLKEEHTILLSSHLLHEMSLVCDEVTIIGKGKILESGKIEKLRSKINESTEIVFGCFNKNRKFEDFLSHSDMVSDFRCEQNHQETVYLIHPKQGQEIRAELVTEAVALGVEVSKLEMREKSLEDIFISLTGRHD